MPSLSPHVSLSCSHSPSLVLFHSLSLLLSLPPAANSSPRLSLSHTIISLSLYTLSLSFVLNFLNPRHQLFLPTNHEPITPSPPAPPHSFSFFQPNLRHSRSDNHPQPTAPPHDHDHQQPVTPSIRTPHLSSLRANQTPRPRTPQHQPSRRRSVTAATTSTHTTRSQTHVAASPLNCPAPSSSPHAPAASARSVNIPTHHRSLTPSLSPSLTSCPATTTASAPTAPSTSSSPPQPHRRLLFLPRTAQHHLIASSFPVTPSASTLTDHPQPTSPQPDRQHHHDRPSSSPYAAPHPPRHHPPPQPAPSTSPHAIAASARRRRRHSTATVARTTSSCAAENCSDYPTSHAVSDLLRPPFSPL